MNRPDDDNNQEVLLHHVIDRGVIDWIRTLLNEAKIRGAVPGRDLIIPPEILVYVVHFGHRRLAIDLILNNGMDPFAYCGMWRTRVAQNSSANPNLRPVAMTWTAFHEASDSGGDLELLLAMAANPPSRGEATTEWKERFFFSQNKMLPAPVQGRPSIARSSTSGELEDLFEYGRGLSMEGLEVMMMYGYKLTEQDIEDISDYAGRDPKCLPLMKFSLAMGGMDLVDNIPLLSSCLGIAIGGEHKCFVGGSQPTSIELARILLKGGADPNGYCLEDDDNDIDNRNDGDAHTRFTPALIQALKNGDPDMAKLLIEYGADKTQPALVNRRTENDLWVLDTISPRSVAVEKGMVDILQSPVTIIKANPKEYLESLRREFEAPLKEIVSSMAAPLVVASMRATGHAPPLRLFSQAVLEFCYGPLLTTYHLS